MLSTDAAWLAGIIDGEGCITITKRLPLKSHRAITTKYDLRLTVVMAHLTTIERIQQVCAAGTIRLKRQKYGDGTHLLWTWEVAAQQAVLVLEAVALYSVTKKSQVELGLSYWKERGDGRNGPSVPTSPALLDLRDEYYQRMRVLKKEVV